ncbi:hypothetical protein EOPP23_16410 [Endozoicomonas sp. OPT23]|uniref:hypothetical protein n=1 Tax=Endozoicomonas sp. OPT23 TaxID=2072845 RepID=UPI00129B97E0|nr:hypothetical protein [Endozoicomonas sp. OPT23]MRI34569.1 hypothetical protein [Endozoicomonas sp. OPT23]
MNNHKYVCTSVKTKVPMMGAKSHLMTGDHMKLFYFITIRTTLILTFLSSALYNSNIFADEIDFEQDIVLRQSYTKMKDNTDWLFATYGYRAAKNPALTIGYNPENNLMTFEPHTGLLFLFQITQSELHEQGVLPNTEEDSLHPKIKAEFLRLTQLSMEHKKSKNISADPESNSEPDSEPYNKESTKKGHQSKVNKTESGSRIKSELENLSEKEIKRHIDQGITPATFVSYNLPDENEFSWLFQHLSHIATWPTFTAEDAIHGTIFHRFEESISFDTFLKIMKFTVTQKTTPDLALLRPEIALFWDMAKQPLPIERPIPEFIELVSIIPSNENPPTIFMGRQQTHPKSIIWREQKGIRYPHFDLLLFKENLDNDELIITHEQPDKLAIDLIDLMLNDKGLLRCSDPFFNRPEQETIQPVSIESTQLSLQEEICKPKPSPIQEALLKLEDKIKSDTEKRAEIIRKRQSLESQEEIKAFDAALKKEEETRRKEEALETKKLTELFEAYHNKNKKRELSQRTETLPITTTTEKAAHTPSTIDKTKTEALVVDKTETSALDRSISESKSKPRSEKRKSFKKKSFKNDRKIWKGSAPKPSKTPDKDQSKPIIETEHKKPEHIRVLQQLEAVFNKYNVPEQDRFHYRSYLAHPYLLEHHDRIAVINSLRVFFRLDDLNLLVKEETLKTVHEEIDSSTLSRKRIKTIKQQVKKGIELEIKAEREHGKNDYIQQKVENKKFTQRKSTIKTIAAQEYDEETVYLVDQALKDQYELRLLKAYDQAAEILRQKSFFDRKHLSFELIPIGMELHQDAYSADFEKRHPGIGMVKELVRPLGFEAKVVSKKLQTVHKNDNLADECRAYGEDEGETLNRLQDTPHRIKIDGEIEDYLSQHTQKTPSAFRKASGKRPLPTSLRYPTPMASAHLPSLSRTPSKPEVSLLGMSLTDNEKVEIATVHRPTSTTTKQPTKIKHNTSSSKSEEDTSQSAKKADLLEPQTGAETTTEAVPGPITEHPVNPDIAQSEKGSTFSTAFDKAELLPSFESSSSSTQENEVLPNSAERSESGLPKAKTVRETIKRRPVKVPEWAKKSGVFQEETEQELLDSAKGLEITEASAASSNFESAQTTEPGTFQRSITTESENKYSQSRTSYELETNLAKDLGKDVLKTAYFWFTAQLIRDYYQTGGVHTVEQIADSIEGLLQMTGFGDPERVSMMMTSLKESYKAPEPQNGVLQYVAAPLLGSYLWGNYFTAISYFHESPSTFSLHNVITTFNTAAMQTFSDLTWNGDHLLMLFSLLQGFDSVKELESHLKVKRSMARKQFINADISEEKYQKLADETAEWLLKLSLPNWEDYVDAAAESLSDTISQSEIYDLQLSAHSDSSYRKAYPSVTKYIRNRSKTLQPLRPVGSLVNHALAYSSATTTFRAVAKYSRNVIVPKHPGFASVSRFLSGQPLSYSRTKMSLIPTTAVFSVIGAANMLTGGAVLMGASTAYDGLFNEFGWAKQVLEPTFNWIDGSPEKPGPWVTGLNHHLPRLSPGHQESYWYTLASGIANVATQWLSTPFSHSTAYQPDNDTTKVDFNTHPSPLLIPKQTHVKYKDDEFTHMMRKEKEQVYTPRVILP